MRVLTEMCVLFQKNEVGIQDGTAHCLCFVDNIPVVKNLASVTGEEVDVVALGSDNYCNLGLVASMFF